MLGVSSTTLALLSNLHLRCANKRDDNHVLVRNRRVRGEKRVQGPEEKLDERKILDTVVKQEGTLKPSSQMSETDSLPPLVGALKYAAERNAATFHFPGHNRGRAAPPSLTQLIGSRPFLHDLPELPELDNLFSPEGPILQAQIKAAELFGSSETWFLVGGTTCGIQAAIMATCSPGEYLVIPRNAHTSAFSAMVLSGAIPKYILPKYDHEWDMACEITSDQVDTALKELQMEGKKASAVFITSPTYHGICSNLKEISSLCHSIGIPLVVDEAHGAHLGFHPKLPQSALQQGADVVVQSTHKVLCSLTQSSMLHLSGNLVDREKICKSLQVLQSTSPNYMLLASLDAARAQISENPAGVFGPPLDLALKLKSQIQSIPYISTLDLPSSSGFPAVDPLRINIGFWKLGLSGYEADAVLETNHSIICELVGTKSLTFAINLGTCIEHTQTLVSALKHLMETSTHKRIEPLIVEPHAGMDMFLCPRDAFFARKRKVRVAESVRQISGELVCTYPPGIPVIAPGEIITEGALEYLLHAKRHGASITGASDTRLSTILVCDV